MVYCNFHFNAHSGQHKQICGWHIQILVTSFDFTGAKVWTTALCGTETVNNKCTVVSAQCSYPNCWLGSHTAKHVYENASSTHSILCTAVFWMHLLLWVLLLVKSSASVEHLNASWMAQRSLVVRNIWASFGLWNSIPQSHLNSNKQLWIYS